MKRQAWAWLTAGVLALGLNGFYQDGGLQWAHQLVERIEYSTGAVLALASGHADRFLAEARMLTGRNETASCQRARQLARVQTRVAEIQARTQRQTDESLTRFEVMSARQQAELDRVEANRARIEAQVEAQRQRWQAAFNRGSFDPVSFESVEINPADFGSRNCGAIRVQVPRVHVRVPRPPRVQVHIPSVHVNVESVSAGPV